MKVLDLIRYITMCPEYKLIVWDDVEMTPMGAICQLASIDPSHYNDINFKINNTIEKNTLIIYQF